MGQKKITELQLIGAISDSLNLPVDDGLQTYRSTIAQIKAFLAPIYIPAAFLRFTAGGFVLNNPYAFVVSGANVTVGATYTNNGVTYTAIHTAITQNIIYLSGNGDPSLSGSLTKVTGTGDSSINFTTFRAPIEYECEMVAAGAGGHGAGTSTGPAPTAGANSTFGSLVTCNGGGIGSFGSSGGIGGTATIAAPLRGVTKKGGDGQGGGYNAGSGNYPVGGQGGANPFGGAGAGGAAAVAAKDGAPNTGAGGGGSGGSNVTNSYSGSAGGAGAHAKFTVPNPANQYTGTIGAGGTKGGAGPAGAGDGGYGADGSLEVWARYN